MWKAPIQPTEEQLQKSLDEASAYIRKWGPFIITKKCESCNRTIPRSMDEFEDQYCIHCRRQFPCSKMEKYTMIGNIKRILQRFSEKKPKTMAEIADTVNFLELYFGSRYNNEDNKAFDEFFAEAAPDCNDGDRLLFMKYLSSPLYN